MRFLHRDMFLNVAEDGADGCGFFDAGHDPYRTGAVDAADHVDARHSLEALRPSHRAAAFVGGAVIGAGVDVSRCGISGRPFAAPRWRQLCAGSRLAQRRIKTESGGRGVAGPAPPAWAFTPNLERHQFDAAVLCPTGFTGIAGNGCE